MAERRREPRFETNVWVGIPDVDGEPELEHCDISANGMLLRTPRNAGQPGAVRMLRIVSADLGTSIEIMAHVVRVSECDDPELGRVIEATAFEFLPHQPQELEDFLCEAMKCPVSAVPSVSADHAVPANPPELVEEAPPASEGTLSASRMVIGTNRPVEAGTRVWVEIEMPSSPDAVRLVGRAVNSRPHTGAGDDERYRIEVRFDSGAENSRVADPVSVRRAKTRHNGPDRRSGSKTKRQGRERRGVHLSGTLSEVGLPSLLGFFELERASGVLRLEQGSKTASLFVREGSIVDVEMEPAGPSATEALLGLLEWPDGAFEFNFGSVDRDDVVATSTTALLMESARQSDENARKA
ncbi:MAG: DUF4388 domain-containing protein [Myxococcota bacterium]